MFGSVVQREADLRARRPLSRAATSSAAAQTGRIAAMVYMPSCACALVAGIAGVSVTGVCVPSGVSVSGVCRIVRRIGRLLLVRTGLRRAAA